MKYGWNLAIYFAISVQICASATSVRAQTIADAKAMGIGVGVTIEDVTITNLTDLVEDVAFINFQVEDATGGMTIFGDTTSLGDAIAGLALGDVVDITGVTDEFAGLFEIDETEPGPPDLSIVDTGMDNLPIVPTVITTEDLLDMSPTAEVLESRLSSLADVTFLPGGPSEPGDPFVGSANYVVSDGVNMVIARIPTSRIASALGNVPKGPVKLVGVAGQFTFDDPADNGYQLQLTSIGSGGDRLLGDVNLDGVVNLLDVAPFVDRISTGTFQAEADINQDGVVNLLDVQPFVDLLNG